MFAARGLSERIRFLTARRSPRARALLRASAALKSPCPPPALRHAPSGRDGEASPGKALRGGPDRAQAERPPSPRLPMSRHVAGWSPHPPALPGCLQIPDLHTDCKRTDTIWRGAGPSGPTSRPRQQPVSPASEGGDTATAHRVTWAAVCRGENLPDLRSHELATLGVGAD